MVRINHSVLPCLIPCPPPPSNRLPRASFLQSDNSREDLSSPVPVHNNSALRNNSGICRNSNGISHNSSNSGLISAWSFPCTTRKSH